MLTKEEMQALAGMSREDLVKMWVLIQRAKAERSGSGCMPQSAIKAMTDVVDDKLAREIVSDLRSGVGEPGGFLGPEKTVPKERGSGWINPTPLTPPSGVEHCDRIAEHFAALDKRELEKRLRGG
jgi:hypothetical protein